MKLFVLTLTAANQKDHARIRKHVAPAFSDSALMDQEPLLNRYFELLVSTLKQQVDGPSKGRVDMMAHYNYIAFDIIRYFVSPAYAQDSLNII
jgi:cytochrome P450